MVPRFSVRVLVRRMHEVNARHTLGAILGKKSRSAADGRCIGSGRA